MAVDQEQLFLDMSQIQSQEDLNEVLEKHGVSLFDVRDSYVMNELPDAQYNILMGREPGTVDTDGGVDSSSWTPPGISDEQMAAWEGDGITSEMLPGESGAADVIVALAEKAGVPPEAALLGAGIVQKNPKKIEKATDGFSLKKTFKDSDKQKAIEREVINDQWNEYYKAVIPSEGMFKASKGAKQFKKTKEPYKRTHFGDREVTTHTTVPAANPKIKLKKEHVPVKDAKPKAKDSKVTKYPAGRDPLLDATLGGAAITALGLSGNRDKDGSLIPATIGKSYSGKAGFEGYPKEEVVEEAPKEERPGWFKPEGSNFWSVKTDSPHWQTDEGAEEAIGIYGELPSWAKQPEVKEFDFSNWF